MGSVQASLARTERFGLWGLTGLTVSPQKHFRNSARAFGSRSANGNSTGSPGKRSATISDRFARAVPPPFPRLRMNDTCPVGTVPAIDSIPSIRYAAGGLPSTETAIVRPVCGSGDQVNSASPDAVEIGCHQDAQDRHIGRAWFPGATSRTIPANTRSPSRLTDHSFAPAACSFVDCSQACWSDLLRRLAPPPP